MVIHYFPFKCASIIIMERILIEEHQTCEDPYGPHIDFLVVAFLLENFWRHEDWRAEPHSQCFVLRPFYGKAEIGEFHTNRVICVILRKTKNVFRFDVPVYYAFLMEVVYR